MSVSSLEEPFEAAVSPVQVNPFGDAQAQDHVVLLPLRQQQVIIIQYIVGLEPKKKKKHHYIRFRLAGLNILVLFLHNSYN